MAPIVSATPAPLATAAQFQRRFPALCQEGPGGEPLELDQIMIEATSELETRTSRRFAPFANHYFSDRLYGIDPAEYGGSSDSPLDIYGSLGLSQANALGDSDSLVRHFYMDQTAPHYPELWTYDIASINLRLTYGSTIQVDPSTIEGPQSDTGHCRLRLGTFAPEGSTIEVVYSGGYTEAIPPTLSRACLYQAAKYIILDQEPQSRKGMDLNELDAQIDTLLASWARA